MAVGLIKFLWVSGKYLPFQKGIVISSKSLETFVIKGIFDVKYIFTRRLNKYLIAHFFSILRQMGRCYHQTTPLSFQHCLKMYVTRKETSVPPSNTNTSGAESTPVIAEGKQDILNCSLYESALV